MAAITAARITNLHERIKLILGTGAGQNGYGELVSSSPVSNQTGVIIADDINNIYKDMISARVHQVGFGNQAIAEVIQNLNVVAEEASFFVNDQGQTSADADGMLKGIADFESLMDDIETDKFLIHPSQAVIEPAITNRIITPWNGVRTHEIRVTFTDADQRRHFFNSGGQIRFSASNTGSIGSKGKDWALLLNAIKTVSFNYNSTSGTGTGSGTSTGNYNLTTSWQVIFQRIGVGSFSSIYNGNRYTIEARVAGPEPSQPSFNPLAANIISFRITLDDRAVDGRIDNNVDGSLTSTVQQFRAESNAVSVAAPSYFNQSSLA